jgi:hypothetical protein
MTVHLKEVDVFIGAFEFEDFPEVSFAAKDQGIFNPAFNKHNFRPSIIEYCCEKFSYERAYLEEA